MASIDAIEGIGVKNATTLRKLRVRTTEALLKAGATRKGRKELAAASGFSEHQILEWVNRADLFRVKGVGEEYSDLLEAAGVDTVKELRTRNAGQPACQDDRDQREEAPGAPAAHRVHGDPLGDSGQGPAAHGGVLIVACFAVGAPPGAPTRAWARSGPGSAGGGLSSRRGTRE